MVADVQAEGLEFPTIDYESVNGRPYNFAYFVWERNPLENAYYDSIIKLDMQSGYRQTWTPGPSQYPRGDLRATSWARAARGGRRRAADEGAGVHWIHGATRVLWWC